ncbi:hypothetical protein BU16DRAFT_554235 [Lophium mytilinum]|uniref:F-box domain-containing protein n=1 Tax=Lophium mytilinum TaxID=390894 RepID=A0A6A6RC81_9PEZI|nr:hypothetical protein BU16DRAFT_554235 [Lophium mytilinum]
MSGMAEHISELPHELLSSNTHILDCPGEIIDLISQFLSRNSFLPFRATCKALQQRANYHFERGHLAEKRVSFPTKSRAGLQSLIELANYSFAPHTRKVVLELEADDETRVVFYPRVLKIDWTQYLEDPDRTQSWAASFSVIMFMLFVALEDLPAAFGFENVIPSRALAEIPDLNRLPSLREIRFHASPKSPLIGSDNNEDNKPLKDLCNYVLQFASKLESFNANANPVGRSRVFEVDVTTWYPIPNHHYATNRLTTLTLNGFRVGQNDFCRLLRHCKDSLLHISLECVFFRNSSSDHNSAVLSSMLECTKLESLYVLPFFISRPEDNWETWKHAEVAVGLKSGWRFEGEDVRPGIEFLLSNMDEMLM